MNRNISPGTLCLVIGKSPNSGHHVTAVRVMRSGDEIPEFGVGFVYHEIQGQDDVWLVEGRGLIMKSMSGPIPNQRYSLIGARNLLPIQPTKDQITEWSNRRTHESI